MIERSSSIRGLVASYLASLPPCSIIATRDVYPAVKRQRSDAKEHVIREALQALAAGSPRPEKNRGATYSAIESCACLSCCLLENEKAKPI